MSFPADKNAIETTVTVYFNGKTLELEGKGNGRLDAVSNAIKQYFKISYNIVTYEEHALSQGSDSRACSYVGISEEDGKVIWGAGVHNDIISSSIDALLSAVNRMMTKE